MQEIRTWNQQQMDDLVMGIGWIGCGPHHAERLAQMEFEDSGMGAVDHKVRKIRARVLGTVHQQKGARSVGVIEEDPTRGLVRIAKPKGVFGVFTPSTNAVTGILQNTLDLLKGMNALIISPQPKVTRCSQEVVRLIREELRRQGAPEDLVQVLPKPTRESRSKLMAKVDVVLATGGGTLVKLAYSSGHPAIGAGVGNAFVIVDGSTDLRTTAEKIVQGKTFEHGSSCSAESALVVHSSAYDKLLGELKAQGGYPLSSNETQKLMKALWSDGKKNPELLCRPAVTLLQAAGIPLPPGAPPTFLIVEESRVGPEFPFSGEKLSVVLSMYRYDSFDQAIALVKEALDYQGKGHSCGIHSTDEASILRLGQEIDVCRVLVNQCHGASNSGSFQNGLEFTPTLGCGSWGGNSVDGNVSWSRFINVTQIARPIQAKSPSVEEVFATFVARSFGR
jgi:sulfoacetaldehyde dehydrogenase